MSEVWINDVDLVDYGFVIGANPTHAHGPSFSDATIPLLGALGPIWAGEPVQAAARRLVVSGQITAATSALFRTAVDDLKLLAAHGAVRLRFADRPDQEFRDARLVSFEVNVPAAIFTNLGGNITATFECADPIRYDTNPQGVPLSTARASLPIGTAPTFPTLLIHGGGASLSGITATYRSANGDVHQTMAFTGSLGANDYLVVDCARTRVQTSTAGTLADNLSWWTSGDFFVIRPSDGFYELAEYPTLELSGTGTPVGVAIYPRGWL